MALHKCSTNFDYLTTALLPGPWTSVSGATVSGGKLVCATASTQVLAYTPAATIAEIVVNVRVNISAVPSATTMIWEARDGTTVQCGLYIKTNAKLQFGRGSGTLIGVESTNALTCDSDITYYDIEAKVLIHSTGNVECRVNGVTEIASTAVDAAATANNFADNVRLSGGIGSGPTLRFIHAIIMDTTGSEMNNFIGPVNVNTHMPTANGNANQWTRGGSDSGANWSQVEETTSNSDTDYVLSATLNQIDQYAVADMPAGVTTVKAVITTFHAKKDDATVRKLSAVVRQAGTDHVNATEQTMGLSYAFFPNVYSLDGAGAPWTVSSFNAAEFGFKVTT